MKQYYVMPNIPDSGMCDQNFRFLNSKDFQNPAKAQSIEESLDSFTFGLNPEQLFIYQILDKQRLEAYELVERFMTAFDYIDGEAFRRVARIVSYLVNRGLIIGDSISKDGKMTMVQTKLF